jgi:hypothetical protein
MLCRKAFLKAFIKIDAYQNEVAFGAWLKNNYHSSIDFTRKNQIHI